MSWAQTRECSLLSCEGIGACVCYARFCFVVLFYLLETGSHVVQAEGDLELLILPDSAPKVLGL